MATGVRVVGVTGVVRGLAGVGEDIQDMQPVFADIARDAALLARGNAPVRSGALRKSIRGKVLKNKAIVVAGSIRVPYARIINYGRSKRRSFMQRADRAIRPSLVGRVEGGLGKIIRRHGLSN